MGTCLSLPWVGERIVEDTGSAITGTRVDVYFDSHAEALRFGRQLLVAGRC
jgi:3D (Asp-Asp-Asp) domain-containing protein